MTLTVRRLFWCIDCRSEAARTPRREVILPEAVCGMSHSDGLLRLFGSDLVRELECDRVLLRSRQGAYGMTALPAARNVAGVG